MREPAPALVSWREVDVLILGCGFTGCRVAKRLRKRGLVVRCTHREEVDFSSPGWRQSLRPLLAPLILHSVPLITPSTDIELVAELHADRVVYISTTSVYGDTREVDETTQVVPTHPRVSVEQAIQAGPWSSLILRPAAIYGPGRGIHVSMQAGKFKLLGDGSNYVSRIHVDDLAAIAEASLLADFTGAYPVADRLSCPSHEIAAYCSQLLGVPMPESVCREELSATRRSDRRVDGSEICRKLGIELRYPSYLTGIPASLGAQA